MVVLIWIICAIACAFIAQKKKRNVGGWLCLGFLFGILSLLLLLCLPARDLS